MSSQTKKVNGEYLKRYFFDEYKVKKGDTLTSIAKAHGFSNPGPIAYFPLNGKKYGVLKNYDNILVNQTIGVPYSQKRLDNHIKKLKKIVGMSQAKSFKHDMEKVRRKIKNNKIKGFLNILPLLLSYKNLFGIQKANKKVASNQLKGLSELKDLKIAQTQYFSGFIDTKELGSDSETVEYLKIVLVNLPSKPSQFDITLSLFNIAIDSFTHLKLKEFDKLVKNTYESANYTQQIAVDRWKTAQKQKKEDFYRKRI